MGVYQWKAEVDWNNYVMCLLTYFEAYNLEPIPMMSLLKQTLDIFKPSCGKIVSFLSTGVMFNVLPHIRRSTHTHTHTHTHRGERVGIWSYGNITCTARADSNKAILSTRLTLLSWNMRCLMRHNRAWILSEMLHSKRSETLFL